MYRIKLTGMTVVETIEELSKLPKDAQVLCGGTVDVWVHVDSEKNTISFDYDDLECCYDGVDENKTPATDN